QGHAARRGGSGVTLNEPLGDTLTVSFDGVDSAPVFIRTLLPENPAPCGTNATTTTTITSTPTTSVSSTTLSGPPTTTITTPAPAGSTTTSTVPQGCGTDTDCDDGDAC